MGSRTAGASSSVVLVESSTDPHAKLLFGSSPFSVNGVVIGGWNKQYWLVPLFDPISATSLGGSRELFLNDIGPGIGSVLWVGKPLGGPEHLVAPATVLVSSHTAGVFVNDGTTLAAGLSTVVTIQNNLI